MPNITTEDRLAIIAGADPHEVPALLAALAARLAALASSPPPPAPATDDDIDVHEAAKRAGLSVSYLYKHASKLPFAGREGRRVIWSASRLEKWRASRMRP